MFCRGDGQSLSQCRRGDRQVIPNCVNAVIVKGCGTVIGDLCWIAQESRSTGTDFPIGEPLLRLVVLLGQSLAVDHDL